MRPPRSGRGVFLTSELCSLSWSPERQISLTREEMAVLADQTVGGDPFRVRRDEGIGGLEPFTLIFCPQFKGHHEVFVHLAQESQNTKELACPFGWQVTQDLLNKGAGKADGIAWKATDQKVEEFAAGRNAERAQREEENIGVKNEQQIFDSKALPAPSASVGWPAQPKGLQRERAGTPPVCEGALNSLLPHGAFDRFENDAFSWFTHSCPFRIRRRSSITLSIAGLAVFGNVLMKGPRAATSEERPC